MLGAPDNTNSVFTPTTNDDPNNNAITDGNTITAGPPNGAPPPSGTTPPPGGGFSLADIGKYFTGGNGGFGAAALIPAWTSALNEFQNAGRYTDLGNQAANRADPFGPSRQNYIDRLNQLYQDPSSVANTPGYKFALNQAMDATSSKLASQGYLGSTQMQNALATESSGLAQQTFNQERDALMKLSGSQFDPANAAQMQMKGGELSMQARSNALGDLFYPFGPGAGGGGNTTINNTTGAGGVPATDASRIARDAMSAINGGGSAGVDAANKLIDQGIRYIKNPDGTTTDLHAYVQHGGDIGDGNTTPFYPTRAAVDDSHDPGSQFYVPTPDDPQSVANAINGAVPTDPNSPFAALTIDDPWGNG